MTAVETGRDREQPEDSQYESRVQICLLCPLGSRALGTLPSARVYELTAAGELEVVHIGRCARIPTAALDDFVQRIRDQSVTKR